ncbi:MAG: PspC domain-containing protein [Firmicutes bacterium]|nr:PspC domain-containing protein [Bacillota bacterium]
MAASKKLYRSTQNRMLGGVCAGIAEFFGIDPTLIRLIYVVLSLFTVAFPGIILYIVCLLIIPNDPDCIDI